MELGGCFKLKNLQEFGFHTWKHSVELRLTVHDCDDYISVPQIKSDMKSLKSNECVMQTLSLSLRFYE